MISNVFQMNKLFKIIVEKEVLPATWQGTHIQSISIEKLEKFPDDNFSGITTASKNNYCTILEHAKNKKQTISMPNLII